MEKILIISHLAINDTNNVGKTLFSIFNKFKKSELLQFFFNPIAPNKDFCESWYRITDGEVLKSLYSSRAGKEMKFSDFKIEEKKKEYLLRGDKTTNKLLFRDCLWKIGRLNKKSLMEWLQKNQPTAIFLAPGYNCFPYRLALEISKKFSIPIITYLMDDFYSEKKNNSIIESVRRKWLQYYIKKIIRSSYKVFSCSCEMSKAYSEWFGKEIHVLYTPYIEMNCINNSSEPTSNKTTEDSNGLRFIYAGSLGLNRWQTLLRVGRILENKYPNSKLSIYANEIYRDEISSLIECRNIKYEGFVDSLQLHSEISKSDIVLHIESFDPKIYVRTRFSISTKIPEFLASGKKFLAIGPEGQAGIEYLKSNNSAIVCSEETLIDEAIEFVHNNSCDECKQKARILLKNNHNADSLHTYLIEQLKKSR